MKQNPHKSNPSHSAYKENKMSKNNFHPRNEEMLKMKVIEYQWDQLKRMQKQRQILCLQNGSTNIVKLSLVPKAVSYPMQYLYIHHQNANEFSTELENTKLRLMWRRKVSLNSLSNLREKDKTRGDMLLSSKYLEKLVIKTSSQQHRNTQRDKDSRMKHQEKTQRVYNWLIPDNSTKNIHLWKRLFLINGKGEIIYSYYAMLKCDLRLSCDTKVTEMVPFPKCKMWH